MNESEEPSFEIHEFPEKSELENSIKFTDNELMKYKLRLEQSLKEDEEPIYRKSIESDKFGHFLVSSYADREFTEPERYHNPDTLEYSPTSRRDSEIHRIGDTEQDDTYRSFDESLKKIDKIIKNSPRMEETKEHISKSPMSSRRNSGSKNRRSESPGGRNQHLGSPADNKNIVYDKFVNTKRESSKTPDMDSIKVIHNEIPNFDLSNSKNQISPLRAKNLDQNDISKLAIERDENTPKELAPIQPKRYDDRMSPIRLPDLQARIEHFSPVPFSQRKRGPLRSDSIGESPRRLNNRKEDDEFLPNFEEFHNIMKDVDEITRKEVSLLQKSEEYNHSTISKSKRQRDEYLSVQEMLQTIRKSEPEMDLNYSLTSDNFSRDGGNPLDEASDVFASIEKYGAEDTISMLTYKTPDRNTMRSSWKRSSDADAFMISKDKEFKNQLQPNQFKFIKTKGILELLPTYEKAKKVKEARPDIKQSIAKIDLLFNSLIYLNKKRV